ncbi:MAG: hypothetical protein HRT92_00075 [Piscirickettsiaceae bacterium]|nr:hypothetical protein [Piscirickettsiaceae bacterium]
MEDRPLDKCINGKSLQVFLVNPPSENPWASREDYLNDQKRITTAQRWTIGTAMASIVTAACTVLLLAMTYKDLHQAELSLEPTQATPSLQLEIESTTQKSDQK